MCQVCENHQFYELFLIKAVGHAFDSSGKGQVVSTTVGFTTDGSTTSCFHHCCFHHWLRISTSA